jgi:undecaprenyl-diphosphatase
MLIASVLFSVLRAEAPSPQDSSQSRTTLTFTQATVLGLVEGITEFLPISSTGHLILTSRLLGLDDETVQTDENGTTLWIKPPTESDVGIPLTPKIVANAYLVVIQAGAIAAVILLYWRTLAGILSGLLGKDANGLRLLRNIIIATFPAALLGLLLDDWIEEHLFSVPAVLIALVAGAVLMMVADRWMRRRGMLREASDSDSVAEMAALSPAKALLIGGLQCFALWPGTSRSMMTIVGGCFAGLRPARAAEFSFLLGLPILTGAALYKSLDTGPAMAAHFGLPSILWGCLVAAVSAALAVRWLVAYLNRHGLFVFGVYRIVLAIVIVIILALNGSGAEDGSGEATDRVEIHQITLGHNT